jgi:hypothetical protein
LSSGGTEGTYDFQFVIYPDGNIDLNYNTINGNHTSTVGIQDAGGNNGMQVTSDIQSEFSLIFREGPDWISTTPSSGQVEAGSSETFVVEVDASGLEDGTYQSYLSIGHGWPSLPVSMLVSGSASMPGDINADGVVNIQDIIFLLNYILGTDDPDTTEFNAADVNEDGVLNIQDIILTVSLILD